MPEPSGLICRENEMKKLLLLLALGTAYYFVQAKEFVKDFTVKFLTAKLDFVKTRDSGFSRIFFTLKMMVKNTTDFTGTLQNGTIGLFYNGKLVGYSDSKEPVEIKAKEELPINVPVEIPTAKLVESIPEMFQILNTTRKLKFRIKGKLNFKVGTYYIDQDYIVNV